MEAVDLAFAAGIAAAALGTALIAKRKWSDEAMRRYIPSAVVTVAGLLILIGLYRWGFDAASCGTRGDVVCVTNANQGVLTLLALLVAVVAIWAEVLSRSAEEKRLAEARAEEQRQKEWEDEGRANRAVAAAIAEMHHNMQHLSLAYDSETLMIVRAPWEMGLTDVEALRHPDLRHLIDYQLVAHVDPLQRILTRLDTYSDAIRHAPSEEARATAVSALAAEPEPLQAFVAQALHFFSAAWWIYSGVPGCRWPLEKPGLEQIRVLCEAAGQAGHYAYFRTSEPSATKVAQIRAENGVVACWFDDRPLGVQTFEFGPSFIASCSGHEHG